MDSNISDAEDLDEEQIQILLEQMKSLDPMEQLSAAEYFLKIVQTGDMPIDTLVRPEILYACIELLKISNTPQVQLLMCRVLGDITIASSDAARSLIEAGAVSHLAELLESPTQLVVGQALWTLAILRENIPDARNFVWEKTVVPKIMNFMTNTRVAVLRNIIQELHILIEYKYPTIPWELVTECLPIIVNFLSVQNSVVVKRTSLLIGFLTRQSSCSVADDSDDSQSLNQRIETFIDAGVYRQMINLISKDDVNKEVAFAILDAINNLASGNDQQRDHILGLGCLSILARFLKNPNRTVLMLASRIVLNICEGGNQKQIQRLMDSEVFSSLLSLMTRDFIELKFKRQAALALASIAYHGTKDQIRQLTKHLVCDACSEILTPFCLLLYTKDTEQLTIVLQSLENLLDASAEMRKQNILTSSIYENGGVKTLQKLENHASDVISKKASYLLTNYFPYFPHSFGSFLEFVTDLGE